MIIRKLFSRTGVVVLAVSVALATAVPAQAANPVSGGSTAPGVSIGVAQQIATRSDTRYCLTFVTADKVPMAVMMACAPGKEGKTQEWIYTESGQLQVAMSKSVGGALATTGACLDSGADLAKVPTAAPLLVLPCRDGSGQKWSYDKGAGTFVNAASGLALTSLLGKGKAKQAQPTGSMNAAGTPIQAWAGLPVPSLDILGAVLALVNALLASLGLALPLPIAGAAASLLSLLQPQLPIPAQMTTLPKQMMQLAQS
ncbi:ricin-type beta-trefoil lectin domain protein [Kribbella kalugense]|uniref:Ricin-type beta-trefoil lectin protein n=1 Tax=Kribbella kalugense TaxID=2512221 RepID=A0A4R7ZN69_9ACTN|nr:ricin-type beta-trefoil lectin domain protein [Kribbella kalugense]TDW18756.1 ricin-type beta-trefoil lectin protein [Kribbella kalugense]